MAENPRKSGKPRKSLKSGTRPDPRAALPAKANAKHGGQVGHAPAPTPAPALIPGIDALARNAGAGADDLLALLCFILCGLAGNEAWLGGSATGMPLAKLDLLVRRPDQALRQLAGQLVARVRGLNRALAAGMQDFSPGVLDLIRRGAYAGGREARFADPQDTHEARQRLLGKLEENGDQTELLRQDLEQEAMASRIEALLHPRFLLESVRCRELEDALDQCHQRTAIVMALKMDSCRAGSEPLRDLRGLLDLMEGLATPCWPGIPARAVTLPLKAHVLLEAGEEDMSLMARYLPEMPGRFLWLSAADIKPAGKRADGETAAAAALMEDFAEAAMEILMLRRAGKTVSFGIADDVRITAAYDRVMARYRRWIGRLGARHGVDPGPAAGELPGPLCFGLGFLSRRLPADGFATRSLIAAAFRSARRLARRHWRELGLFLNAERVKQGLELAWKIASRLDEKGPLTRRELVRGFNIQCWQRYEPVIGPLIGLGVLAWQEDGKLAAGEVDLSEVEDELRQALLAPTPATTGAKNAGKTRPRAKARVQTQTKTRARKQAKKQGE